VVLASVADAKLAEVLPSPTGRDKAINLQTTVTKRIRRRESSEETIKTIRVRECRVNLTDLW